ncbi:hypothetical protein MNBD_GAMMA09-1862 [hydrothermal vent metagenome]|uniref:PEP-CTERM protein-sorting domain-containing protein n=1 Tax=hydrothermal vent metagenome TaxID=652676 RepID=A0A3B0XZJ0_9ZZZZ
MNNKLKVTIGLVLSTQAVSAYALNAAPDLLSFNPGVLSSTSSGGSFVSSGSYFAMDLTGDGAFSPSERMAISPGSDGGLIMGAVQLASGSHGGQPDGTEIAPIDAPWSFMGNTGMHLSNSPTTILSDDGAGNMILDFSGWGVTWNGIPLIALGGGIQDCGTASDGICVENGTDVSGVFNNGTGAAVISCAVDCSLGDTFTLDYTAVVPRADPSNFGGVGYLLHLEGVVSTTVPVPAAVWLFGSGLLGLAGVARRRKI